LSHKHKKIQVVLDLTEAPTYLHVKTMT